jgi:predicted transcriptional regulator
MRKPGIRLTKFEHEIMDALWTLGTSSVRELVEHLPEKKRPAYTTVQTIVYRLEEKGAVRRVKKIGNAHVFEAAVTRESARGRIVDDVLDLFGGSARPLMAHLAEAGKLTLEDVRDLERTLERLEAEERAEKDATDRGTKR